MLQPFAGQACASGGLHQAVDRDSPAAGLDERVAQQAGAGAIQLQGIGEAAGYEARVDIVRRQERDHVQQVERAWRGVRLRAELFNGDPPGGGHRIGEQFARRPAIALQVIGDGDSVGLDVCGGDLDGQRQVAQRIAQFAGGRGFLHAAALLQKGDGFGALQLG